MPMKGLKAQVAGLNEFTRQQKEDSRQRLLAAAERTFCRDGYIDTSVDDIIREAGVSRPTFYRHFDSKIAVAMELYDRHTKVSLAGWLQIGDQNYADPATVLAWITMLFDFAESKRETYRIFVEMGSVEPRFVDRVKVIVPTIIEQLGERIPAFAEARGQEPIARRRWINAWLFFHHLREQCNMNAIGFMSMERHHVIDAFTDGFLDLLHPEPSPRRRKTPV